MTTDSKPGDRVIVESPGGHRFPATITNGCSLHIHYTDDCGFCGVGWTHRIGMGGTRLITRQEARG
ncbi:hypothetical protein [Streptomyces smyrnaeus]|uniref:hypothetical protein n=1 Tax=Streptomyces smyrnaeus TaxID=1387713 RepID=UPI0034030C9E